jgi:RNA-directed DNA polymerase
MKYSESNFQSPTFPDTTDWSATKWHKVNRYVDNLQKRIYLAKSKNNARKVRDLQRILINSKAALVLAIRRVTQINKGRRTPGIDGFRALSDKKRGELVDTMRTMNIKLHNPRPSYRMYIKKKNGKLRSLGIPAIVDRIYQEIIRMALEPEAEVNFEPTSYGFRPRRGCHDALSRIMYNIRGGKWEWVFEGDFKSCFDTLSHNFILQQIKRFPLRVLVEKFLKAGYLDDNVFHDTKEGTPQGGILSPLLANIALNGMERILSTSYSKVTHKNGDVTYITKGKYRMVRYADDFVIFAQNKEDIEELHDILNPYLKDRGLALAKDKTGITHISDGFDFLGFNFRRYKTFDGYIHLCKPSKDSIQQFRSKVAEICRQHYGHNVDELIKRLNPLITGTANYWKPSSAKKTFSKMDNYIWKKIFKFVQRLHPNKPMKWIKKRYFPQYNDGKYSRNWIFTGPKEGNRLTIMEWTPIRRHIMIQYNHSPYDRSKTEYFYNRAFSC